VKITAVRTIVCAPGRNFVTVKIDTDEGITGIGDATLNGRELAVVAYLDEHLAPCLIGATQAGSRISGSISTRRLLAARAGDDGGHRRASTPRSGTSRPRRRACRSTSFSAARAASA
jgi:L-alanine-DL-glutamate epimerase-like enolase superfamily enzyme